MKELDVLVIGGGAAGYFCACELLIKNPALRVSIWEKSSKTLSKVRISGGGRCNVTHNVLEPRNLIKQYPRGGKYLKHKFQKFNVKDTISWFQNLNIELKTEADNRMFPVSNSSETIAAALEQTFVFKGGELKKNTTISELSQIESGWLLTNTDGETFKVHYLVFALGGMTPSKSEWLSQWLNIEFTPFVPSIFTLNLKDPSLKELSGVSVGKGRVKYEGIKAYYEGPILITHWGLSGPAVLASSAWQAVELNQRNYQIPVYISWVSAANEDVLRTDLKDLFAENKRKQIQNVSHPDTPKRLWIWLLRRAQISLETEIENIRKDEFNRLIECLIRCKFEVNGKTTYKEEFVTAGGVALDSLSDSGSLKHESNVYFIGEMLNIDGITGGFNFQAAWSTSFVAANDILSKISG